MSNIKKAAIEFYLDWVNNFLTSESMAEHYSISREECIQLIDMGRKWHSDQFVKNPDTTL